MRSMSRLYQRIITCLVAILLIIGVYMRINHVKYETVSEKSEEFLESLRKNTFVGEFLPTGVELTTNMNSAASGAVEKTPEKTEKDKEELLLDPCTVVNPLTNGFYDLRELGSLGSEEKVTAWSAKGFDYGKNFTLGICSTPFKQQGQEVHDVSNSSLVGGFYSDEDGNKFSIGEFSTGPVFRGRKLTLTYEGGSYCNFSRPDGEKVRKSAILSFACDREIMSLASVSFVGALNDCDYFFEVRTVHACATAAQADNLAVIWIFFLIVFAALLVYCSGGFLYKRVVLNHRGWKQVPSYGVINGVFKQIVDILRGGSSPSLGRSYDYEDQNNLLDALDIDSDSE